MAWGDAPTRGSFSQYVAPSLYSPGRWGLAPTGTTTATPSPSVTSGVSPLETSYSLYGHIIPLSVFGVGRIGGEIISGPWVSGGLASFIISFGVPADPSGTRILREIAFDSEVVWTGSLTGAGTPSSAGFSTEAITCRFYDGNLTQAADALETANFGADAIAYRPQILLAFENVPLAATKFQKIPYVSAVIADTSGDDVNLGEALERLAYSPWVGYTSSEFETSGITDGLVSGGLIIAQESEFLATIQQFGRFYPWDILQTDMLRVVDRGNVVAADLVLNKTRLMDQVVITRAEPNSVPRELELATIDPDADYTIVPAKASRPRAPVNVSASVRVETAYLPAIMDSYTRQSIVTYAKYREEQSRKRISGTAMIYGLEMEPGALVAISGLGNDFTGEIFSVKETLHGANHVVEFVAESILRCAISIEDLDPHWAGVVLLMGFEDFDGSTGAPGMADESSREHGTATVNDLAQIDTSDPLVGVSSLNLDGSSDFISFPDDADWLLSSANSDEYTVECSVKFNAITGPSNVLVGQVFGGPGSKAWVLQTTGTSGEFEFLSSADGTNWNVTVTSTAAGLVTGTEYHIAADKDSGGTIRIYLDGVMVGSDTPADSSMFDTASSLVIGCLPGGNGVNGWIDEIRITKGIARYASDAGFAVPTMPFPRS